VPRESPRKSAAARYAEYSSLALMLPASTFVGYVIGSWLDKKFATTWLTVVFIIIGSAAGFIALIRQILKDSNEDDK
jgi:F0F1-type ATP synthase assembly protein I